MAVIIRECQITGCVNTRTDRTWYDEDYCPKTNSFRCESCEEKDLDNGPEDIHHQNREFRKKEALTKEIINKFDQEEPNWRTNRKYRCSKEVVTGVVRK